MTRSNRLRIALAMREDELRESRRRERLLRVQVADLVARLREIREREALAQMSAKADRFFEAMPTQEIATR